jgi:hypothetical protein
MQMNKLVRDYDSTEGVDDESPTLVAKVANAGRKLFDTVERSEQNTELVNVREQRAESQQVEETYLVVLEVRTKIAVENDSMSARLGNRTVYCGLSGYGEWGPDKDRLAYSCSLNEFTNPS